MNAFENTLQMTVDSGASDLILKVGSSPAIKVNGRIRFLNAEPMKSEEMMDLARSIATTPVWQSFEDHGEADFSFELTPETGRFRVNLFRQRGEVGMVMRQIQSEIPSLKELGLPVKQLEHLSALDRGLVLVTGQTGSGKSTTLASILDLIIQTRNRHIVTLEDPVEFLFRDELSIVNQREIGVDTMSFSTGLRACLREAPDIIMVGEIRDAETMEAALAAAETGHLVFSTLHTVNAAQTIERIFTFFPPHQHERVQLQISTVLAGVVSQRLLPSMQDHGMLPAVELLLATPRIKELLAKGDVLSMEKALNEGEEYYGTQTFNRALKALIEENVVSLDDALAAADCPDDLKLALRGVESGALASRLVVS